MITPHQIRAARALLDWTQRELARRSGLSLRALNSIERGLAVPRLDNLAAIQGALEKAQIEFLEHDGVRRRTERLEVLQFEGAHGLDQHMLDLMQEMREPGEALYSIGSEEKFGGMQPKLVDEYFAHLHRHGIRERLLIRYGETHIISPTDSYRWLKQTTFDEVSYIVYGGNVAFQIAKTPLRVIIIRNPSMADMFRRQFEVNWAMAEIPWFAPASAALKLTQGPWSLAKAEQVRAWIDREAKRRKASRSL